MKPQYFPPQFLILDIDGLRQDAFHAALASGQAPHLARLLDGGIHLDPISTLPSITFCAQSTIFTGALPREHGIPGNQFFDRLSDPPRLFAFDIGDTLAVDDAIAVFTGAGLLNETLSPQVETIYESAAERGIDALVLHHMISRGARTWLPPSLLEMGRFLKGPGPLSITSEEFDDRLVERLSAELETGSRPGLITAYFLGLDHETHARGVQVQQDYLTRVVDPQIGRLLAVIHAAGLDESGMLAAVVSDHGQIDVIPDDHHALRLSYPGDMELAELFHSLGLDVNDKPREGAASQAVVASNGGMAHVYLRRAGADWRMYPDFERDVLPVAASFYQANQNGLHAPSLRGTLDMVLVRDAARNGWDAPYFAFTPAGLLPVSDYLAAHPRIQTAAATHRLEALRSPRSGDILLFSNYAGGYYFSYQVKGNHGGLHPEDSRCVLSLGLPGGTPEQQAALHDLAAAVISASRARDGREFNTLADLASILRAVIQ